MLKFNHTQTQTEINLLYFYLKISRKIVLLHFYIGCILVNIRQIQIKFFGTRHLGVYNKKYIYLSFRNNIGKIIKINSTSNCGKSRRVKVITYLSYLLNIHDFLKWVFFALNFIEISKMECLILAPDFILKTCLSKNTETIQSKVLIKLRVPGSCPATCKINSDEFSHTDVL